MYNNNNFEFLRTFVPSEQMRDYLRRCDISDYESSDIVNSSLESLEEKVKWLQGKDQIETEKAIQALYNTKPGEFFCLTSAWYDKDIYDERQCFLCPVNSYEKAIEHIRYDKIAEESDRSNVENCEWYILEKWGLDEDGDYCSLFTYYIIDEKAVYFKKTTDKSGYPFESRNLNLPVPFEPGDILTIDCRPFAPPVHSVLIEKGDNSDCCCLQVLYKDLYAEEWMTCALKHGLFFRRMEGGVYDPVSSPLLRLTRFDGGWTEDEQFLQRVSNYIRGKETRGRSLWKALHGRGNEVNKEDATKELMDISKIIELSRFKCEKRSKN